MRTLLGVSMMAVSALLIAGSLFYGLSSGQWYSWGDPNGAAANVGRMVGVLIVPALLALIGRFGWRVIQDGRTEKAARTETGPRGKK